jgi:hypothetical protein
MQINLLDARLGLAKSLLDRSKLLWIICSVEILFARGHQGHGKYIWISLKALFVVLLRSQLLKRLIPVIVYFHCFS